MGNRLIANENQHDITKGNDIRVGMWCKRSRKGRLKVEQLFLITFC